MSSPDEVVTADSKNGELLAALFSRQSHVVPSSVTVFSRRRRVVCHGLAVAIAAVFPTILPGQAVRGLIVDRAGTSLAGVVVQLVDSAGAIRGRALSNERGEFRVTAPAGIYRMRTLRIGFRATVSEAIELAASPAEVTRRVVLEGLSLALDTVRVGTSRMCRTVGDSAAIAFTLWEQARAALTASELSTASRMLFVTSTVYARSLDPVGRRVLKQTSSLHSGYVSQPWRSLTPDSLHRVGYATRAQDGSTTYYAPGVDVILSDHFIEDHCFRLVQTAQEDVGVAFEPTPERGRTVTDISGTVWLDRATASLRRIEYRYQNATRRPDNAAAGAGGEMSFVRLSNGMWMVAHWAIRMPVVESRKGSQAFGETGTRVAELSVTGGDLVLVRRGADTLWSRSPLVLGGVVQDSLSRAPVPNALVKLAGTSLTGLTDAKGHFGISGVLPGDYVLEVTTPSLDSISAVHRSTITFTDSSTTIQLRVANAQILSRAICDNGSRDVQRAEGMILGTVSVGADSARQASATVTAQWTDRPATPDLDAQTHWLDTRTDARGAFRFCGLPLNTPVVISALAPSTRQRSLVTTSLGSRTPFAKVDLILEPRRAFDTSGSQTAEAVLTGLVVADSNRRPVPGAEIALPSLGLRAFANRDGMFRLPDVPAGTYRFTVRHIGYGAVEAEVQLPAGQVVNRRVVLERVTTLDSVLVTRPSVDLFMRSFEENRHVGLGHFLTSSELRKMEGRTTGAVLSQLPGIDFARGTAGQIWVVGGRGPRSLSGSSLPGADEADVHNGAPGKACYALVYLDNALIYAARNKEPLFDVNSIPPERIEAIEYYAGPAETPLRYSVLGSVCGVLVIWTRRTP